MSKYANQRKQMLRNSSLANHVITLLGDPDDGKHAGTVIAGIFKSFKPGFHMIVGDRSRSLGSLVNCSAIVTIIWKPNFHFASYRQRSQRQPTIATITIAVIESESISAIVAIVNDRQRSQKVNGNHQCSEKTSDCSDRNDPSEIWKP